MMIEERKNNTNIIQNLVLENRNKLSISGVNDVDSFDEKQISAFTEMGFLTIKGSNLHINRFNTQNGELNLSGKIDSFCYSNREKMSTTSFISKLFK